MEQTDLPMLVDVFVKRMGAVACPECGNKNIMMLTDQLFRDVQVEMEAKNVRRLYKQKEEIDGTSGP